MNKKIKALTLCSISLCILFSCILTFMFTEPIAAPGVVHPASKKAQNSEDPIKWVDFNIPYHVMKRAMDTDIDSYDDKIHISWIDILAYLGAKYGGQFSNYSEKDMDEFVSMIKKGTSVSKITDNMKYFSYYNKAYDAVLGGFLGEYQIKIEETDSEKA